MNRFDRAFYKIKILTPVHIGSGEELDPFSYVIRDDKLHFLNRDLFIEYLDLEGKYEQFLEVCSSKSHTAIIPIRKFIMANFTSELSRGTIEVADVVAEEYREKIDAVSNVERDGSKIINMLAIKAMIHPGADPDAIIPGSSLKGSIRTAILDYIVKNQNNKKRKGTKVNGKNLENIILEYRDMSDDPFKALKLSDFEVTSGGSYVDKCYNIKSSTDPSSKSKGIPVNMEFFKPGTELLGSASIDTLARVSKPFSSSDGLTHKRIFEACRSHYSDTYQFEKRKFKIEIPELENLNGNKAPIKIGAHSGAYALTLEGYRKGNISNPAAKKKMDHQTTTWITSGKQIGWATIEIISEDNYKSAIAQARKSRKNIAQNIEQKRAKIYQEQEKREQLEREKLEKEKLEREKEKRESERIESLPPEQWAAEMIDHYAKDFNEFCSYIQDENNPEEQRRELSRKFFQETPQGKKKLKSYRKKLKKGTDKKTILLVKTLLPELFK